MPGTLVSDALAPVISASATKTATFTTTGVQVDRPRDVRVRLQVTGTVSGTTPTLDVEIQACDDSAFGSGIVSLGKFAQVTATLGTTAHYLRADVMHAYVRAVCTIAGTTPSFGGLAIDVVEPHYEQIKADTA